MCMAVLGAFNAARHGKKLDNYELAELAYEIETVRLGNASGRQTSTPPRSADSTTSSSREETTSGPVPWTSAGPASAS